MKKSMKTILKKLFVNYETLKEQDHQHSIACAKIIDSLNITAFDDTAEERANKALFEAGLTDEKGCDDHTIKAMDARNQLIDFIIYNVVPRGMRDTFIENRQNYKAMEKLLKVTRAYAM